MPELSNLCAAAWLNAHFPGRVPSIFHVLKAGKDASVAIEVLSHLDDHTVRGIAMTPARGLSRGAPVIDTGETLKVPVGDRVLGRMFNVFGETIDARPPVKGGEWRTLHSKPLPLMGRDTRSEVFTTGIKAIDILARARAERPDFRARR